MNKLKEDLFNIETSNEELELLRESLWLLLKNTSNSLEASDLLSEMGEIKYDDLNHSKLHYKDKSDRIKKLIKKLPHVVKSLDVF